MSSQIAHGDHAQRRIRLQKEMQNPQVVLLFLRCYCDLGYGRPGMFHPAIDADQLYVIRHCLEVMIGDYGRLCDIGYDGISYLCQELHVHIVGIVSSLDQQISPLCLACLEASPFVFMASSGDDGLSCSLAQCLQCLQGMGSGEKIEA